MSNNVSISEWFSVESAPNPPIDAISHTVLKFLKDYDNESILEECRMLLHPLDIAACDLTFACVQF